MVVIDIAQAVNIAIFIKGIIKREFLIEGADKWRTECWEMIRQRSDLHFLFLTKRIERFLDCIPHDWEDGYENVTVGCTIENQENADYRLRIFPDYPLNIKISFANR